MSQHVVCAIRTASGRLDVICTSNKLEGKYLVSSVLTSNFRNSTYHDWEKDPIIYSNPKEPLRDREMDSSEEEGPHDWLPGGKWWSQGDWPNPI